MRAALRAVAGLIWFGVGTMLLVRGLRFLGLIGSLEAYSGFATGLTLAIAGLIGAIKGRFVLSRSALRNIDRIHKLPRPRPWQVFAPRFYPLIGLMMGLGFVLRRLATIGPGARIVVAGVYCGIGAALAISSFAYLAPERFRRRSRWLDEPVPPPQQGGVGVLLANLGTPDAPTPKAVGEFLRAFLGDPRVVEVARPVWWCILNLFIVPFRKYSSAALYRRVFTEEGSPLLTIGRRQTEALQAALGPDIPVRLGMRYGDPSIRGAIEDLKRAGVDRILVVPAYPQYSGTTTASIIDEASDAARAWRLVPSLRFMPAWPDDPEFIEAVAVRIEETLADFDAEHVVLSYHGIPVEYSRKGDPYAAHCVRTSRALVRRLGLARGGWTHCYQSQFGSAKWLGPATDTVLETLAADGVKRVAVVCPAFLVDCLETIDEIGHESRHLFREAGGEDLRLVPCVNDHPRWIEALARLCRRELGGWIPSPAEIQADVPATPRETPEAPETRHTPEAPAAPVAASDESPDDAAETTSQHAGASSPSTVDEPSPARA